MRVTGSASWPLYKEYFILNTGNYIMTDLSHTIVVEARNLDLILDALHIGIIAHTPDRTITFFNSEAEKITGYKKEEVLGKDCHDVFQGPFCGGKCSFCDGPPSLFSSKIEYPVTTATKNGSTVQLEMTVSPIITKDHVFKGVVASFRDMTELFNLSLKAEKLSNLPE
jgi:PAS domain S-box-containing protein